MDRPTPRDGDPGPPPRLVDPYDIQPTETMPSPPTGVGSVLKDRYLLVRPLGHGGFGNVFVAHDRQLHDRAVVVKIKLDHAIEDPWFERKFSEELRALTLIDHPGVVGALDSGTTPDGRPFLVMQYIEGRTLRSVLAPEGLPFDRVAGIVRQVGQALGAAHEKKIWHRDLKPENIMLQMLPGGDEHVRLIDFGIATIADLTARTTRTRIAGSLPYMAPEQVSGQPSAATDIYAFGVIAYEMVTGRKPFVPEDPSQLAALQRAGVRVKPSALRPGIASAAEKLILQSLSYNPNDRPGSALAFGDGLQKALENSQSTATLELELRRASRRKVLWAAGALAGVMALGGVWVYRNQAPAAKPTMTGAIEPPPAKIDPLATEAAVELTFWNSIRESSDPRGYQEYLAKYPNGKFAALARLKLEPPRPAGTDTETKAGPKTTHTATDTKIETKATHTTTDIKGTTPKRITLPALRAALKPEEYNGPLRGELRWTGSLEAGGSLTIQGGKAGSGSLAGDLPRVPVTVEATVSGVTLAEEPSATNQWDRLVVKNASSKAVDSIRVRWRIAR